MATDQIVDLIAGVLLQAAGDDQCLSGEDSLIGSRDARRIGFHVHPDASEIVDDPSSIVRM